MAGDVVVADGEVVVDGRVDGDVIALHAPVSISGRVDGDVVGLSEPVVVHGGAFVGGDIEYADERPFVTRDSTVRGDVEKIDVGNAAFPFGLATLAAIWLAVSLSSLALGLLLIWIAPRAADAALRVARDQTGVAIAAGAGFALGLPVAAAAAAATLVGLPLALAVMLALLPLAAIGYATSAWMLGRAMVRPPRGRVPAYLAGWGVLRGAALAPVLGILVWLAAAAFGVGALAVAAWNGRSERAPTSTTPGAAA